MGATLDREPFKEYLIKKGPYCYDCGDYLGSGYKDGDQCLECWQKDNEDD